MKKTLKILLGFIATLIILVSILLFLGKQERSMALEVALVESERILNNSTEMERLNIPSDSTLISTRPVDTDLFELTWIFIFDLKPKGNLEIRVLSPHGLPFLPLFNSKKSLNIQSSTYYP